MADTKNAGPLLVSYGAGDINALPVEWRARMGFRQEDQQVPLGFVLDTPSGDPPEPAPISETRLIQTRTDERKRTSVTLNPPSPNGGVIPPGGGPPDSWMLVSEERLPWGQVATRTRAFVPDGSHLVLTDTMLQAEQRNLGIGLDQVVLTAPLPGPGIVDTKFDDTSSLVSTTKTRKLISSIVDGENIIGSLWRQVTHESETATVASEVVVSRTLPGPTLPSTRFDNNSVLVTINRTKKLTSAIIEGETVTPTLWLKTYGDGLTGLISTEIVESRALPGPAIVSSRFDTDNALVTIIKTQKKADQFTDGEVVQGNTWTRTTREGETGQVATEVKEARTIPGLTILGFRLDNDDAIVTVEKTKKLIGSINEGEVVTPTQWKRTYSEQENLLIATEVVETRSLGAAAPSVVTTHYDTDNTLVTITKTKKQANQFTDGEGYDTGTQIWSRTTREGVTNGIAPNFGVATEVIESRKLPGQEITSYRIDENGDLVTVTKTKKLLSLINEGELTTQTLWRRTSAEGETLLFATEVVEERPLGGSANVVESYRIDDDGATVTVKKNRKRTTDIVEGESATAVLWTKVYAEGISGVPSGTPLGVATEVTETRPIGPATAPIVRSSRTDPRGFLVRIEKVKRLETSFSQSNTATASLWTKIYKENVDGLVATQVTEFVDLAGTQVVDTKIDSDGFVLTLKKTIKQTADCAVAGEDLTGTVWTKTYKEHIDGPVSMEVLEQRPIPGAGVASTRIDPDGLLVDITKTKESVDDVTPPVGESLAGNIWKKVYTEGEDKLIVTKVIEARNLANAPIVVSSRVDRDGLVVSVAKKRRTVTNINPREVATDALWTKVFHEDIDGFVCTEVTETAVLPGPLVTSTKTEDDGRITTITKQRKHTTDTTNSEILNGTIWTKSYKEGDSGVLATQVVETRQVQPVAANTIPSAQVDRDLLVVTTTKALKAKTAITPSVSIIGGNLTTVEQKEVSDLVSEEIKSVKPTFDPAKYGLSIENPLPQQFRSLGIIKETNNIVAGQAVVPSGLLAGELEKSQEQVNALQKKTVTKSIDTSSLPVAYAGKELSTEYGGVYLLTEKKIATFNDTTVDILPADATTTILTRAKLERFGGFKVRDKATVSGGFPILKGGNVDPEFPFIYNFTEQVVDPAVAGTKAVIGVATVTEIKPLDAARSLKRITTVPTAGTGTDNINNFKLSFPGTTDVSIPPQLISLTAINAGVGGGAGSYASNGSFNIVNRGSGRLDVRAEAEANASAMIDVVAKIKQIWGQNIPCTHYLFFVLGPTVAFSSVLTKLNSLFSLSAVAWPRFQPEAINFSLVGQSVSGHAQADQHLGEAVALDYLGRVVSADSFVGAGSGTSGRVDYTVKTVTIPPTIHALVTISAPTLASNVYSAVATVNTSGFQTTTNFVNCQAGAFVNPASFAATGGQQTIPSGVFVHRVKVEPWKFGYFKVDCEVVNSGDW